MVIMILRGLGLVLLDIFEIISIEPDFTLPLFIKTDHLLLE
jgi:hypothetical protein